MKESKGIHIDCPGSEPLLITRLLLDFNGTLACDGKLLAGVAERLIALSREVEITILTSDTFGTAGEQLENIPVRLRIVRNGKEKRELTSTFESTATAAIGNGKNDVEMFRRVSLGIGVLGPEGASKELIGAATILVSNIQDALDLFAYPKRLEATLRP